MISATNNSHHSYHHSYHVFNPSILIVTHSYLYSIYLLTHCHPKYHFDSLNFIPHIYFMSIHYSLSHTLTICFCLHCFSYYFLSTIITTVHKDYNRFIINDSILIIAISLLPTNNIIAILYWYCFTTHSTVILSLIIHNPHLIFPHGQSHSLIN